MTDHNATSTPPTAQGVISQPHRTPAWVTVIAVISFCFAGLGILQYGCNSLFAPVGMWFADMALQSVPVGAGGGSAPGIAEAHGHHRGTGFA